MTNPTIEELDPNFAQAGVEGDVEWHDLRSWNIEGRGWNDTETPFDRLPARAKGIVRDPVWNLSQHSSGLSVRFVTDAITINARWRLRCQQLEMTHMPATGVSGLDLYIRTEDGWRWAGGGRPAKLPDNETCLVGGLEPVRREYQLYLPLYNGVTRLAIGVGKDAFMGKAPAGPELKEKPICFYGTSVTQGGCASRPGMAYPAIIGRRLARPIINLGFSGSGQAEPEISRLLAELDPAIFVIDCLANMDVTLTTERLEFMVTTLRNKHPQTPIVLLDSLRYQNEAFVARVRTRYVELAAATQAAYERLLSRGLSGVHYLKMGHLLGADGEATVDGIHATDLGFLRLAEGLTPVLADLL